MTGAGTVVVEGSQSGDGNFNPAPVVDQTFQVNKATATVTLDTASLNQTYDGTVKTVTATTNPPGLGITFAYGQDGHPVTSPIAPGTYVVMATITDLNYQGSATGTLTITPSNEQITLRHCRTRPTAMCPSPFPRPSVRVCRSTSRSSPAQPRLRATC